MDCRLALKNSSKGKPRTNDDLCLTDLRSTFSSLWGKIIRPRGAHQIAPGHPVTMSIYQFLCRIRPETASIRLDVTHPPLTLKIDGTEADVCTLRLLLAGADVVLHVTTSTPIQDIPTLKNQIQTVINSIVDGVCYYTGQVVSVEITSVILDPPWLVPFGNKSDTIAQHALHVALLQDCFFELAVSSVHLRSALADLREAVGSPNDTGFFAYRSVEAIMQSFKDTEGDSKKAWQQLRDNLRVSETYLKDMTKFATSNRHGALIPMSGSQREVLILKARSVIHRFASYLGKASKPLEHTSFPQL